MPPLRTEVSTTPLPSSMSTCSSAPHDLLSTRTTRTHDAGMRVIPSRPLRLMRRLDALGYACTFLAFWSRLRDADAFLRACIGEEEELVN